MANGTRWYTKIVNIICHPGWMGILTAIVIAVIATLYQDFQDRVSLSYSITDTSPLLDRENINEDWEISYKDESVNNPYLFTYQFKNTGLVDINKDDFEDEEPITIDFGIPNTILSATPSIPGGGSESLIKTIKEDKIVDHGKSEVQIGPVSLLVGESINVKIIADNPDVKTIKKPIVRIIGSRTTKGTGKIERFFLDSEESGIFLPMPIKIPRVLILLIVLVFSGLLTFILHSLSFPKSVIVDLTTLFLFSSMVVLSLLGVFVVVSG